MEWVEAIGKTVDQAVDAALAELGITSRESAVIEVLQEPKAGFLGFGGQEAIVKVMAKPAEKKPRRRRERNRKSGRSGTGQEPARQEGHSREGDKPPGTKQATPDGQRGRGTDRRGRGRDRQQGPRGDAGESKAEEKKVSNGRNGAPEATEPKRADRPEEAPIEEQAEVAVEFLQGLLDAFGLEGDISTRIEDETLFVNVDGEQTEALVGTKGVVMQSVHEITRTVIQRKTFGAPRLRLDIAGYAERRRQALTIYARKLADKVIDEGTEVMLEPMNSADRKVVHDAVTDVEGVRSFSEGEEPHRAVVLAPTD